MSNRSIDPTTYVRREFFFSGVGSYFRIDKTQLFSNDTYDAELAAFIDESFPLWMAENHAIQRPVNGTSDDASIGKRRAKAMGKGLLAQRQRLFGRHYTDNFQLRALAGCASGECLDEYDDIDEETRDGMRLRSSTLAPRDTENCTHYFMQPEMLFDSCHKGAPLPECPDGCDGPCFYDVRADVAPLGQVHLDRAIRALESFDAVLLTEKIDDEDQSDFLSDLVGAPRDARYALKNRAEGKNSRVEKSGSREKTHFYRDLLTGLGLRRLNRMIFAESRLEIELFRHAEELNGMMIDRWRAETAGMESRDDADDAIEGDDGPGGPWETTESAPAESGADARGADDGVENDHELDTALETLGNNFPVEIGPNQEGENRQRQSNASADEGEAHDYGVLIVMYHKTGYVLSRLMMKLVIGLEYEAGERSEEEIKRSKNIMGRSVDHVDERTGEVIAFNQRGNWNNNFVPARKHHHIWDNCPPNFKIDGGAIYLQEAPDFYCSDERLAGMMLGLSGGETGKTKIVHFVRNPFNMVLSNYYYHAQEPTPEKWVHIDDPCEYKYPDGVSLASHVLPTLKHRTKITPQQLVEVVDMCHSLYRSDASMKNATFYEHLLKLDHWRGLQLATAQMIMSSSFANKYLAGGDILRMANNVIKFQNLQTSPSIPTEQREKLHLLTLSMDDYIASPKNVTLDYLNFVLGRDDTVVSGDLRMREAEGQESKAKQNSKKSKNKHVTQGKHEDKEELRQKLRDDRVLGPILSEVELLIDEALGQSKEFLASW